MHSLHNPNFNSSTECWKTVLLKCSFGLSVETLSWFSRLVSFDYIGKEVFTSFISEKNLWTNDKIDVLMYKKNIYEK